MPQQYSIIGQPVVKSSGRGAAIESNTRWSAVQQFARYTFDVDGRFWMRAAPAPAGGTLCLEFGRDDLVWATAKIPFHDDYCITEISRNGREIRLRAIGQDKEWTWQMRLRQDVTDPVIHAVEVTRGQLPAWQMELAGATLHTHKGIALHSTPVDGSRFRLGAFTQHGQLFDLRDWIFVEQDGYCSGVVALKPGSWSAPAQNFITAMGNGQTLELQFPRPGDRMVRSWLLVHASTSEAIRLNREGIDYFEPKDGYPEFPARLLARHGYARPERIANISSVPRPVPRSRFPYGNAEDLRQILSLCREHPQLTGGCPFWEGRFDEAAETMLNALRTALRALTSGAYLHPLGNPVALRPVAPAIIMYSMLDALDALSESQRFEGASLISALAELLMSRDFYPHHVAMIPEQQSGCVQQIYAGMLNQNFNTDRYATVGIAGCALHWHRHARRWLAHAMQQLDAQLDSYLYPGGTWEESHTYANHVKLCLLPLVEAVKWLPDGQDWTADRRFRELCRFFVQLLSPPDKLLGGARGVPAIGDHGYRPPRHPDHYSYSYLFAWMASAIPTDRDYFLWAWQQSGRQLTLPHHAQVNVLSPIFFAPLLRNVMGPAAQPDLPERATLAGYGAYCRRDFGQPSESLLVVRCGDAWGHYHPDQGSFWWWSHCRLLCADADLGEGELKFRHDGHNVVGYIDREPMQYLWRHPYTVEQLAHLADGTDRIECRVPCYAWYIGEQKAEPIPPDKRPVVVRRFDWLADGVLRIVDLSAGAPGGRITWNLHVPAADARYDSSEQCIIFQLDDREQLKVKLPFAPESVQLRKLKVTWHLRCVYEERELVHELHHVSV